MRGIVAEPAGLFGVGGVSTLAIAAGPAAGTAIATNMFLTGAAATLDGLPLAGARAGLAARNAIHEAKDTQFYFLHRTNARLQ